MAKNDLIILDSIIDERTEQKLPSVEVGEVFEYFAFEQILKDCDLSSDELASWSVDWRKDGWIDGFYIIVNGHLLQNIDDFSWPKSSAELQVKIVTCKHNDSFKQATLDALIASLTELLDFRLNSTDIAQRYSKILIDARNNLIAAYKKLAPRLTKFSVSVTYTSRWDTSSLWDEVVSRGDQIKMLIDSSFDNCEGSMNFLGCSELIKLYRKKPTYSLELPFIEALSQWERYVILAHLDDYFSFVSDEGKLRRYLFDSNVRDFMGLNRVNDDIKQTLEGADSTDFWWLNNWVTILASSARIVWKSIQIQDIQIVNWLQTTESVFRYFESGNIDANNRSILVKVIVSSDEIVRDRIIRATNNQTAVEPTSLHATDKIQRDIEHVLLKKWLFYERRKNFYTNQNQSSLDIVTPLYLASWFTSLILKQPFFAIKLNWKRLSTQGVYESVFNEFTPLDIWPQIARLFKKIDTELEKARPTGHVTKFVKRWRQIVAFLLVSKLTQTFNFNVHDLIKIDIWSIMSGDILGIWEEIHQSVPKVFWQPKIFLSYCEEFGAKYHIRWFEAITNRRSVFSRKWEPIDQDFIDAVLKVLPPQPWKPWMNKNIVRTLRCSYDALNTVIDLLVNRWTIYNQKDGVLYDKDWHVISFDKDRVDPVTLKLLDSATDWSSGK